MNPSNLKRAVEISKEIDDLDGDIAKLKRFQEKMEKGCLRSSFVVELIDENNYTFTCREIEALTQCKENRVSELTDELTKL